MRDRPNRIVLGEQLAVIAETCRKHLGIVGRPDDQLAGNNFYRTGISQDRGVISGPTSPFIGSDVWIADTISVQKHGEDHETFAATLTITDIIKGGPWHNRQ